MKRVIKKKPKLKKKNKNVIKNVLIVIVIIIILLVILYGINKFIQNFKNEVYIDEIIGKTVKAKNLKVRDSNGDMFYLPKGFKISENQDEQTVEKGLVIIDDTGDKQTEGSEFVWIPVENYEQEEIYLYKTLNIELFKENLETKEYIEIQNSISKYGGFYIARYEAGISNKLLDILNNNEILSETTEEFANGEYKPVSKLNSIVWNFIPWGGNFEEKSNDKFAGNEEKNGAVKVARSMYSNNLKTSVGSNLCYGKQWDLIMNYIDSNYYKGTISENSVIANSLQNGNYYGAITKTGENIKYYQKNISDLAGNVWEWTMEAYEDLYRVSRGGSYATDGQFYTISSSKENYPNDNFRELGFRVALWLK